MISPETLRRYPHFAGLSDGCLKKVALFSAEREFKAGEKLFEESGEFLIEAHIYEKEKNATHLMLLTKGEVDIVYMTSKDETLVVGTVVSGDLMGIAALIPPYQLTATGIAKQDGSLIQFEAEKLRELCEEDTALGYGLMKAIATAASSRLQETRIQLAGKL